ncbi:hypothetical protein FS837_004283 [Tulasnella sp. UAMH 9824]|nr:hypothetical protein FS837_004283 [Tulasnella sp. UAMH 9824]
MNTEAHSAQNGAHNRDDKDQEFDQSVLDGYITEDNVIAPEIVDALRSNDQSARLEAAAKLHRLVDKRETASIQPIINSGILQDIVSMISLDEGELQVHLNAVLVTITTGSSQQVSLAVETGAIPKFILLASSSTCGEARGDAIVGLGNIGGTSRLLGDTLVGAGGLKPLLDILNSPSQHEDDDVYSAAVAIKSFTRRVGWSTTGNYMVEDVLPTLVRYISDSANETPGSLEISLSALDNIMRSRTLLSTILDTNIIPRLVQLCTSPSSSILQHALLCVGRVLETSDEGTGQLIHAGVLEVFRSCILSGEARDRGSACFAISNIVATTLECSEALIEAGLVPIVVKVASDLEEKPKTRHYAVWTLLGLSRNWGHYHHEILETLMEANSLEVFFMTLKLKEATMVGASLGGIVDFVGTEWEGKESAIQRSKAVGGVATLRAVKLRPEPWLAAERLLAHKILKVHLQVFSLPPRV